MTDNVIHARVGRTGLLIAADAELEALHSRIGGRIGGPLLVPQLARLASLVQRNGLALSRTVIAADDQQDYSMWARFSPDPDGVSIAITDWQAKPRAASDAGATDMTALPENGWLWRCDALLRVTALWPDLHHSELATDPYVGGSITDLFSLQPNDFGRFPLLAAMAAEQDFGDQQAELLARMPHQIQPMLYRLSGQVLRDDAGRFAGFSGHAVRDISDIQAEMDELPFAPPGMPDAVDIQRDGGNDAGLPLDFGKAMDANMRAPLGRIIANADTIAARLEGPIRQDYANYARDIALAGRHLMGLIDDLADMQAIERPDFSVAREPVDLGDAARRAAGLLAVKLRDRQMTLKAPAADEHVVAIGEFRRILQILLNLIGNAVRYAPEQSEIWISIDEDAGHAYLTVADQGIGIPAEKLGRVFEKFERLGRTDHGGSGLGLYISRKLARAMGGDLSVDSAAGQGARFTLSLPKQS